jgi:hypothetical protein
MLSGIRFCSVQQQKSFDKLQELNPCEQLEALGAAEAAVRRLQEEGRRLAEEQGR